jgi:hypothetical protein
MQLDIGLRISKFIEMGNKYGYLRIFTGGGIVEGVSRTSNAQRQCSLQHSKLECVCYQSILY